MTNVYVTPAQSAARKGEWTPAELAAWLVGRAQATAEVLGMTDALQGREPAARGDLMAQLGEEGRATAANLEYRAQLAEAYYDAYSMTCGGELQVPA